MLKVKRHLFPYDNFASFSQERNKIYHNRRSSDLTIPKTGNNQNFTNMGDIRPSFLQSEQKSRRNDYYLNFKNSQDTGRYVKLSKVYSKEYLKSDIEIEGKDLHPSELPLVDKAKPTISIDKFKFNIKNRIKSKRKYLKERITDNNHLKHDKVSKRKNFIYNNLNSLKNSQEEPLKPRINGSSFNSRTKVRKKKDKNQ